MGNTNVIRVGVGFPARLLRLMFTHNPPLTFIQMQRDTGISWKTMSRWANSECEPSGQALHKVCKVYNWNPNVLARQQNEETLFE